MTIRTPEEEIARLRELNVELVIALKNSVAHSAKAFDILRDIVPRKLVQDAMDAIAPWTRDDAREAIAKAERKS